MARDIRFRRIGIRNWETAMRRTWLALALLVGSGCFCSGCGCPPKHGYPHGDDYRRAELEDRQRKAESVIDALKRYNTARGKYPEMLDELVATKLLDELPKFTFTTDHQGKSGRIKEAMPLQYVPSADRSTFELRLDFTFSEFSMENPRYVSTYSSFDGKWRRNKTGAPPPVPKTTGKN